MNIDLETFPEFITERDRFAEAQNALRQTEGRITELTAELADRQAPTVASRAELWLSGGNAPEYTSSPGLKEQLMRLYDQRRVLVEAVRIQQKRVDDTRMRISEQIVQAVKPAYVDLIKRLARIVTELGALNQQEGEFRDRLTQAGVVFGAWLTPCPFPRVGHIGEEYSAVNLFLREIAQFYPELAPRPSKIEKSHVVRGE